MLVVVPFVPGMLADHTAWSLAQDGVQPVYAEVGDDGRYADLIERLWRGGPFIVVEQDVVPWPGALERIWTCHRPWCAYGYSRDNDLRAGAAVLGCAKFDPARLPPDPLATLPRRLWSLIDVHLTQRLRGEGHEVHQHWPAVRNLNPRAVPLS